MKNKGFLFKILGLLFAVATVVFACLVKFCFKASAEGGSLTGSTTWSIFGDASKADKTQIAQYAGIEYDSATRTFAVFLLVILTILVIALIALTLYGKFSSNPFEACSGTCNIISVVISLLGFALLATILSYVKSNTAIAFGIKSGIAVANVTIFVLMVVSAVMTSVMYIIGAVNSKK